MTKSNPNQESLKPGTVARIQDRSGTLNGLWNGTEWEIGQITVPPEDILEVIRIIAYPDGSAPSPDTRTIPINQETVTDLAEHLIPRWGQLDAFHQRVAKEQILDALNHAHRTTTPEREEGTNGHD